MDESFSEIVSLQLKKMLPLLCATALLLFSYIPIHLPFIARLRPDVGIICVFFWSLYRQDLFNIGSVFILGFIADCMSFVPMGLNIFVYLLIFVLCSTFGRYINMKSFIVNWLGFAAVSALALMVKWLIISVYYHNFLALSGVGAVYMTTLFWYPLFARLNMFIQNRFLYDESAVYE